MKLGFALKQNLLALLCPILYSYKKDRRQESQSWWLFKLKEQRRRFEQ